MTRDSNTNWAYMFSSKGTENSIGKKGTSIQHFTGSREGKILTGHYETVF